MSRRNDKMPDAWRHPKRRRDDQPSDLEQLRAAGWFWVGYLVVLAFGIWLAVPSVLLP